MSNIDETHDPLLRSWNDSANGHHDFPIQNLPLCIFRTDGTSPRGGVAIGDAILDLRALDSSGLAEGVSASALRVAAGETLNGWLGLPGDARQAFRRMISSLLSNSANDKQRDMLQSMLHPAHEVRFELPASVGDYTDFFAGIHHARRAGRMFRPDQPLLPNYKHIPIAYHGRASSLQVSGTPLERPSGQYVPKGEASPRFGPSGEVDFEAEIGIWIGPGNELGKAIPVGEALTHVAGFSLLNDWSARDIQRWEAQPLGPFLGKSVLSTLSPFIVTTEALAPFRRSHTARDIEDPPVLPYLMDAADQASGSFAVELSVFLTTPSSRESGVAPHQVSVVNSGTLYWTPAQMIAHHTSNGCNLRSGDLLGTGTISGPGQDESGSLLEYTEGGRLPLQIGNEVRTYLEDGDEVIFQGRCHAPGFISIGFGECRGSVALPDSS